MFHSQMASEARHDCRTRLLIVDDDEKLCRLLREYFLSFGYSVDTARDGQEGLDRALNTAYGAIILDIMLPGMNGIDVLRELRRRSLVPVLMLTARADEADRIAGLEVGADDYLPKTFSTRELLARLRAVLRRSWFSGVASGEFDASPISFGGLWLEPASREATLDGSPLALTPIEYEILLALARSQGPREDKGVPACGSGRSRFRSVRPLD